jgi:thioredoxin 1
MSIKKINDRDFKTSISAEGVTLVDFGAVWCPPCKTLLPMLDQLDADYAGRVTILKLDVDESPDAAAEFGVMSMPTVLFFKDGVPVDKLVGLRPLEVYKSVIGKFA